MAIKTVVQGSIPAVSLEYLHSTQVNISVSEEAPYRISLSSKVRPYGKTVDGDKIYAKEYLPMLNVTNVDAFVSGLPPADQLKAVQALTKIQEGLGTVYELFYKIDFAGVE